MDRPAALKALDLPLDATPDAVRTVVSSRRRHLETQLEFARDPALSVALRADLVHLARVERIAAAASTLRVDRLWIAVGVVAILLVAGIAYLLVRTPQGRDDRPQAGVEQREPTKNVAAKVSRVSTAPSGRLPAAASTAADRRAAPTTGPAAGSAVTASSEPSIGSAITPFGVSVALPQAGSPAGRNAVDRTDPTAMRPVVDQPDREAMFLLGRALAKKRGADRDPVAAVGWYRKAARRGHPLAMNDLGWAYYTGFGVDRDRSRALDWFRRGAALGEPAAMNNLGVMLDQGDAVARDVRAAVDWFRRAAAKGNPAAMYHLALAHETGAGVEKDLELAEAWYRRAAAAGDADAKAWIAGYDAVK